MLRSLPLVLLAGTVAFAQPPGVKEPEVPTADVRKLAVAPAAAPTPALKYELLPKLRDRAAGNAALDYHRAYMLRPSWPRDPKESAKLSDTLNAWDETPVDKLPVAEVKKYLEGHALSFRALDAAAKSDRCDWELTTKVSVKNIDMFLPEVQALRELARVQRFRIRVALAEGDFDAAMRDIQTGLRLGKDAGEGPTYIHALVGIAISAIFLNEVEQLVQRAGSPNLYWALTVLPRPLIDPRTACEGESRIFDNLFPNAKQLEKGPVSAEKANTLLEEMMTAFSSMGRDMPNVGIGGLAFAGNIALAAPGARKHLAELGWPAATVEKMPPAQAVALRAITAYRAMTDDHTKCFSLPYPEARAELAKVRERAQKLKKESEDPIVAVFALTLPAMEKVLEAHARINRRVAALRAVEAVRLHAAANGGKPPKALGDVKLVPVPEDPWTAKPFEYAATDAGFTLAGGPGSDKPNMSNNFRYEVTLRR